MVPWCCCYFQSVCVFYPGQFFKIHKQRLVILCIPANLSPFGEIHRFEIKIGHPSESCRSEEFLFWGSGGGVNWPAGVYEIAVRHGENVKWCSSQ